MHCGKRLVLIILVQRLHSIITYMRCTGRVLFVLKYKKICIQSIFNFLLYKVHIGIINVKSKISISFKMIKIFHRNKSHLFRPSLNVIRNIEIRMKIRNVFISLIPDISIRPLGMCNTCLSNCKVVSHLWSITDTCSLTVKVTIQRYPYSVFMKINQSI